MNPETTEREYDFTLVCDGVTDLDDRTTDALFEAGCDDATFGIQYGQLCADFSRRAGSMEEAVLSAIADVERAGVGAKVICVDECNLVTQAEIARRIGRTRSLVSQYISGERGPGNFPPPECLLAESKPLWRWCAVSRWLARNDLIRSEEREHAVVVAAINAQLELARHSRESPALMRTIRKAIPVRA